MILFHSVVGCNYGTMAFHANHCMTDIHQGCTVIGNKEVIMGGEASLQKALGLLEREIADKTVIVITGCVSEIMGDDVEQVCDEFRQRMKLVLIHAPGFEGGLEDGYEQALLELMGQILPEKKVMVPSEGEHVRYRVNILGFGTDDYLAEGDICAIGKMLEEHAQICCAPPFCSIEDLTNMTKADFTIVFGRGQKLAQFLQEHYDVPYQMLEYPFGLVGMRELLGTMEARLGLDYSRSRGEIEKKTLEQLKGFYYYMKDLYGAKCAIYANSTYRRGLIRFMEQELGMDCVLTKDTQEIWDEAQADQSRPSIVAATSFEKAYCERRNIPLIRVGFPVIDRVAVSTASRIGAEGTGAFVGEIINEVLEHWSSQKGSLYEKNMHLR